MSPEEIREALADEIRAEGIMPGEYLLADALLPTVQALIADAEKRAAARALESYRRWLAASGEASVRTLIELRRLIADLDPSGAAEGAGR